jgi:hypothetical protein
MMEVKLKAVASEELQKEILQELQTEDPDIETAKAVLNINDILERKIDDRPRIGSSPKDSR